jgi:hypothetical protein
MKKKKVILVILLVVILAVGLWIFVLNLNYSEGFRAGIVLKVSRKGVLFKTYEGQLNLGGLNLDRDNLWEFSVADEDTLVIQRLEEAALSRERVELIYEERYIQVPWRGDTKYFVRDVKRNRGKGPRF